MVEAASQPDAGADQADFVRVGAEELRATTRAIFEALDLPTEDAARVADALVEADRMGVSSHGVSNYIQLLYVPGLRSGAIAARPQIEVLRDLPSMALVDGGSGMGHVVGDRAMRLAIDKARTTGIGVVAVRNSRHFGAAGYYARLAARERMIGLSLTNSDTLVLPTFGRDARLGTNPIAVAAPAGEMPDFHLDMATSTVPLGKLMLARRAGEAIPEGWAADQEGKPTRDAAVAFDAMRLLPLGGSYAQGSHKGYGLAVAVDLLCGLLSDGVADGGSFGGSVGHFFAALRVDALRPIEEFESALDGYLKALVETPPADAEQPVIYAGWKEHQAREDVRKRGVPLHSKVVEYLRGLCSELGVECRL